MRNGLALALWFLSLATVDAAVAAGSPRNTDNQWLMMVTTENTDPLQESAFNEWYDHIDIPDVLKVPGYERARRGVEQRNSESAAAHSIQGPLKYVALYDIESPAIDKTIIDMLMASWDMEKSHHSTNLLKVTERVYFHQYEPTHTAAAVHKTPKANKYLYMARFDCCRSPAATREFDRWYTHTYIPAVLASGGFARITRYKLYRVLMDQPVAMPEYLDVAEIDADSAAEAAADLREVRTKVFATHREHESIANGAGSLFLQINDVRRQ